jgi:PhnB protein
MSQQRPATSIAPWISVPSFDASIEFYRTAFGAEIVHRGGPVARLSVDGAEFWVGEDSLGEGERRSPPVRMILSVADPDALFPRALQAGAMEVCPITEAHGWRIGRIVDPFGHHWEIGRPLN